MPLLQINVNQLLKLTINFLLIRVHYHPTTWSIKRCCCRWIGTNSRSFQFCLQMFAMFMCWSSLIKFNLAWIARGNSLFWDLAAGAKQSMASAVRIKMILINVIGFDYVLNKLCTNAHGARRFSGRKIPNVPDYQ